MRERILFIGPPGGGKSQQLLNVIRFLEDTPCYVIDLEDKLEAMLSVIGTPSNMNLSVAIDWEELKDATDEIVGKVKPDDWIMVDRMDLSWPGVQRWFTQQKYQESLATKMLERATTLKKSSMFIPVFDMGSWQVINEAYDSVMHKILYKSRCNVILTAGIKGIDENSPMDVYGNIGVLPRGQKEIGHQPHSVFLLTVSKRGREIQWHIQTAKDIPGRPYFDREPITDFAYQYLANYYGG